MRQIPRALGAALTVPALLLASACGGTGQGATPTQPGQLKVVVAFYPFQYVAERVAGSDAKIENLTQPGAEPHDLELTPKQIASLSDADVVIYQKGFQTSVDKALEQAKPKKVVDVSTIVHLHPAAEGDEDEHEHGDEHADEHGDEHADEHGDESASPAPAEPSASPGADEHGHDEHEHGGLDPHGWLNPHNMVDITRAVSTAFAESRPEQKETFTKNSEAAVKDLDGLDTEFEKGLKTCKRRDFVTSHAAFGYLADRYKLTQIAVRGMSPDEEPSPARIAEVQKIVQEHGITTIFYETLVSPAVSQSIAKDLHLKTDVLDPLEGLTDESRGKNYVEVMQSNLKALQAANECS